MAMTGLLTDLYQLTMAAGYFEAGKSRRNRHPSSCSSAICPRYRNYVLAAGLEQVVDYLQ